jgi:Tol biopolymer transport system component
VYFVVTLHITTKYTDSSVSTPDLLPTPSPVQKPIDAGKNQDMLTSQPEILFPTPRITENTKDQAFLFCSGLGAIKMRPISLSVFLILFTLLNTSCAPAKSNFGIVFGATLDGNQDIYSTTSANPESIKRLTFTPTDPEKAIKVTKDGSRILFYVPNPDAVSDALTPAHTYVLNLKTQKITEIGDTLGLNPTRPQTWSIAEDQFVLSETSSRRIYLANPDEKNVRELKIPPSGVSELFEFHYSPDEKHILYILVNKYSVPAFTSFFYDVETKTVIQVGDPAANCLHFEWSSSGKQIVLLCESSTDGISANYHVKILDIAEKNTIDIQEVVDFSQCNLPTWSPDGKQILMLCIKNNRRGLFLVNSDGSNYQEIELKPMIELPHIWGIVWAPDGRQFLYSTGEDEDVTNLYIANIDGSNNHIITAQAANYHELSTFAISSTMDPKEPRSTFSLNTTSTPPAVPLSVPYQNCTKTPGLWGCGPSTSVINGKVAFYDSDGRLVVIDLGNGTGWQVLLPHPGLFSWSPNGSQLLVQMPMNEEDALDGRNEYIVYDSQGKWIKNFEADYVNWRENGTLWVPYAALNNQIVSSDGAMAWADEAWVGEKLQLHLQDPSDLSEQILSLDACRANRLFRLYTLFPEVHNLIAYMPQESIINDLRIGSEICWIDTQARKIKSVGLHGHLGTAGLSELKGDILAVIDRQWEVMPFGRLALLNGRTGQVQFPLPESTVVRELAWQPGSSDWLALATAPGADVDQKPNPNMPVQGIYLYNFSSSETRLLVPTEVGWRDGLLRWSKDGKFLIYAHFEYSEDRPNASLMIYRMVDGKSWPLVIGLASPVKWGPYLYWGGDLAVFINQLNVAKP